MTTTSTRHCWAARRSPRRSLGSAIDAIDDGNNVFDNSYDDLNLELWSVTAALPYRSSVSPAACTTTASTSLSRCPPPATTPCGCDGFAKSSIWSAMRIKSFTAWHGRLWPYCRRLQQRRHRRCRRLRRLAQDRRYANRLRPWRANFGASLFVGSGSAGYGHRDSGPGASAEPLSATVPEPHTAVLVAFSSAALFS